MLKTLRDKITVSGVAVLVIGVALLIFTFVSAYGFLTRGLAIITSGDLVRTFGEALAPLIETCIHVMYLGIMGWIGSILTVRGVTILSQARQTSVISSEEKAAAKKVVREVVKEEPKQVEKVKEEKPKSETKPAETEASETKPYEPEVVVLTPETVQQKLPQVEQQSQPSQEESK